MRASLRALLSYVIDYAGTFPPARLSLDDAAGKYVCYQLSPHAWMLGRFVCPATLVPQLQKSPHWPALRRYPLALIGPADADADEYCNRLIAELEMIKASALPAEASRMKSSWSFEFKFSHHALRPKAGDVPWIFDFPSMAQQRGAEVFLEVPLRSGFDLRPFGLHVEMAIGSEKSKAWGLKFRAGGPTTDMVPAAKHLAKAIRLCRDYGIRWKATAGLHHPLRHFDESVGTLVHGFLNLLCAAVLSHARQLSETQVGDVLKEESPAAFQFTDDALCWRDFHATVPEIEAARRASMVSFGSCSFDEPVQGLKSLGLIE